MGRYLERAQHLCGLLRLQTEALVARPVREIYFGWRRIYTSIDRQPPGGRLELVYDDDFTLAGRLAALVHHDWPDREDHEEFLRQVDEYCRELHTLLTTTYFDYHLGDFPAR